MAAAERIRDLRQRAGPIDEQDEETLALYLVENVLWGYDINLTATHMAASTLGMLSPSTKFGRMNVHRTLLGVYEGTPYLGSLEFLTGQPRLAGWPSISQQVDDDAGGEPPEQPPKMDLVIMNPPFTRSDIRHDQFNREDEAALKSREKEIVVDMPDRQVGRLHSSGGMFAALAEWMLKRDGATLALILPSVVPSSSGNAALRRFLADRFHVDTVVASHDPERIFFSENTNIGEVLIICRRWRDDQQKPATRFVNLAESPTTAIGAHELARRIQRNEAGAYTVQMLDADRVGEGDWSAVNFFSPTLVAGFRQLSRGRLKPSIIRPTAPPPHRPTAPPPHRPTRPAGAPCRSRPTGSARARCLRAQRYANILRSPRIVVSQNLGHAVDAGAHGCVARTKGAEKADGGPILGAAWTSVAAAPALAPFGAGRSSDARRASPWPAMDSLPAIRRIGANRGCAVRLLERISRRPCTAW